MGAQYSGEAPIRSKSGRRPPARERPRRHRPDRAGPICSRRGWQGEVTLAAAAASLDASAPRSRKRREVTSPMPVSTVKRANGRSQAVDVETISSPGFPTDLQAEMMAAALHAQGTSVLEEKISNRFTACARTDPHGREIDVHGGHATVTGVEKLKGAPVDWNRPARERQPDPRWLGRPRAKPALDASITWIAGMNTSSPSCAASGRISKGSRKMADTHTPRDARFHDADERRSSSGRRMRKTCKSWPHWRRTPRRLRRKCAGKGSAPLCHSARPSTAGNMVRDSRSGCAACSTAGDVVSVRGQGAPPGDADTVLSLLTLDWSRGRRRRHPAPTFAATAWSRSPATVSM